MKIAILDDEADMREKIKERLEQLLSEQWAEEHWSVELFSSASSLVQSAETTSYVLYLLDICMSEMNGMEAAEKIRALDANAGIIFLTNSEEYLLDGYRVFADGYFLKPIDALPKGVMISALQRIFQRQGKKRNLLFIDIKGKKLCLPFEKIQSVDIQEGSVHIITTDREIRLPRSRSYREISSKLLEESCFLECYHRIIVNMDYVVQMEEDFILESGRSIPISQRRKMEVKSRYMQYLLHSS